MAEDHLTSTWATYTWGFLRRWEKLTIWCEDHREFQKLSDSHQYLQLLPGGARLDSLKHLTFKLPAKGIVLGRSFKTLNTEIMVYVSNHVAQHPLCELTRKFLHFIQVFSESKACVCGCPIMSDAVSSLFLYWLALKRSRCMPNAPCLPCLMHRVWSVSVCAMGCPILPTQISLHSLAVHSQQCSTLSTVCWRSETVRIVRIETATNRLKLLSLIWERYTVLLFGLGSADKSKINVCLYNMLAQHTSAVQIRNCEEEWWHANEQRCLQMLMWKGCHSWSFYRPTCAFPLTLSCLKSWPV